MKDPLMDVRYAARMLAKNPGFTAVAVIALASGIGANTAIFSVVNAVLLRPLPFPNASRLVAVDSMTTRHPETGGAVSYPDFQDFRTRNHSLRYLIAFHDESWPLTGPHREAANLHLAVASADLFAMTQAKPLMGRTFRKNEDEDTTGPMSLVLSEAAWKKYFGADPAILGKSITLRGLPYTVIGVMPAGFNFPVRNEAWDAWTTFGFSTDLRSADGTPPIGRSRGSHYLDMAGELKPGVPVANAQADLDVLVAALAKSYPNSDAHRTIRVAPLLERLVEQLRPVLLLLLGAVGCVLLVACANVANLLLARATTRHRELAIRAALGAGRARVIRQVLTESVLLSLLGGAAGLLLGIWGSALLVRLSPEDVPRVGQAQIDIPVFLFTIGIAVLTGVIFGLVPAFRASQSDPADALKDGTRGTTEGLRGNKARSGLIIGEVALALMLLACAGLLIRSLDRLNRVDPGFQTHQVLSAAISFPEARYKNAQIVPVLDHIEQRLRALPDVAAVSDIAVLPLSGNDMNTDFEVEGHPVATAEQPSTRVNIIAPGYLNAMRIPLVSGRDLEARDDAKAGIVAVINTEFAKQFFPGQNPLGKRIRPGISNGDGKPPMREIVGVVGSVEQDRIGKKPIPEVFLARDQLVYNSPVLVIRTRNDARAVVPELRSVLRESDPNMPIDELRTMDERVALSLAQPRFQSLLLASFAGVALLLTAIGLYGVISYSVAQRTREIGTRMALGAQRRNILKLVIGQGMLLTTIGVAIGIGGAILASKLIESMLYEVTPGDPLTLLGVAGVVFLVAMLASIVPAVRAAGVDPLVALRYE